MNDRELADAVVALGVGRECPGVRFMRYRVIGMLETEAERFVRDWRVAGALMEKVDAVYVEALVGGRFQVQVMMGCESTDRHEDLSTPRAIIEACVKALK